MLSSGFVVVVAGLYLGGLFLIAFATERQARRGAARFVGSPVVYTLSLAVYCTSWTFYGAVGSAARNGLEFLTIYLGPTIVLMGWWVFLRKLVRISKAQRITSIADFISARYGKSGPLSALVTIMALVGITPYIALQLKAVAASFDALGAPVDLPVVIAERGLFGDTGFWVAVCMAAFVIMFGTRNLGADERHPGIVAAIAFESIVKLLSLAAIALFCVYGIGGGLDALFASGAGHPDVERLFGFNQGFEGRWVTTLFLAGAAIICLPRQFQVAVVENADERHVATASWLFPLYLLLISICVVPIAVAGLTTLPDSTNPDLFVLTVPLSRGQETLALIAFIGGLSAATSMVIVASIALSIMISNHLVTPLLLRIPSFSGPRAGDFSGTLLLIRRVAIVAILTLGFVYYRVTASSNPLASIGLISFAGAAQFLPALVGGISWPRATHAGALCGLLAGFVLWAYTLLVPSFADAGWAFNDLVAAGPWGIALLKPDALFGFGGWDPLVHGVFWSVTVNVGVYIVVSLLTEQSPLERLQSALFVNAFQRPRQDVELALAGSARTEDLFRLTQRVLGPERAFRVFRDYAREQGREDHLPDPEPTFVGYVERQLASSVGAASARTLVSGIVEGESISLDAVIEILDETQQAIRTTRELERKSRELEETAEELRRANDKLTTLDRMKDDFLSRVSHELRTPMTSIRSFSEILADQPDLDPAETQRFLGIIRHESSRLTRLLDEILDLSRMESGEAAWTMTRSDAGTVVREALDSMRGLATAHGVALEAHLPTGEAPVVTEPDRLKQVVVNLLSNAIKYNDAEVPRAWVELEDDTANGEVIVRVRDNGSGIPLQAREDLFAKFSRGWNDLSRSRGGSGLGLAISRQIMHQLGGDLAYDADAEETTFVVRLRRAEDEIAAE